MTIILYLEIYAIAQELLHTGIYTKDKLSRYLNDALKLEDEIAMLFISRFYNTC